MRHIAVRSSLRNQKAYVIALALLLVVVPVFAIFGRASAADLPNRSVRVDSSTPSTTTDHHFGFTIATAGILGSIKFQYCSNSPLQQDPCTAPAGLSLLSASLTSQSGATGFSVHGNSDVNNFILTRVPALNLAVPATYTIGAVVNPSTPGTTVFVRVYTYTSNDASGSPVDRGGLAFSTSGALGVGLFVPPYLSFCVGVTAAVDCATVNGTNIDLGELSTTAANAATSQFSVATNDPGGTSVSILGTTMTSGNNIIPALATPNTSNPGTGQFGINLRSNNNPDIGDDPAGAGTVAPTANYGAIDSFSFSNGDTIASSPLPTEYSQVTVSYLVNISSAQPPGIYAMTATFVATAAF